MKKPFAILPIASLAFAAACADTPTSISPPDGPAFNETSVPTASGPTWVTGNFQLTIELGGGGAGINKHPQGKGTCRDAAGNIAPPEGGAQYTRWHAPGTSEHVTGAKFCEPTTAGETQVVNCTTDPIAAVYAFGGSGAPTGNAGGNNENLNFIGQEWGESGVFVHYNAARNRYTRQGTLIVDFSCEQDISGTATINLAQSTGGFMFVDSHNRQLTGVVFQTSYGNGAGTLEWEYRSRNDIPPTT